MEIEDAQCPFRSPNCYFRKATFTITTPNNAQRESFPRNILAVIPFKRKHTTQLSLVIEVIILVIRQVIE
jgi:hypothetical protein